MSEEMLKLILGKMDDMKSAIDARLDTIDARLDTIDARLDTIDARLDSMEQDVTWIKLHLENETDRNISILAENYGSLVTKLNEAVPAVNKNSLYEVEISVLKTRVGYLENGLKEQVELLEKEVKAIKNKIA